MEEDETEEIFQFSDAGQTDEIPSFFQSSCPGGQMFDSSESTDRIIGHEDFQNYMTGSRQLSDRAEQSQRRKRGPYKLYLTSQDREGHINLPKTTKWRRLQNDDRNPLDPSSDTDLERGNAVIEDINATVEIFNLFECEDQQECQECDDDSASDSDQNYFSIWPLQGILNELPPKQRKENVFLHGLWFGTGKPFMTSFLHPFTEEMKRLSSIGLDLWHGGVKMCSRLYACICSCDSVARCVMQNIHQFNGLCGCSWCLNPGETIEKGRGHARVYTEGPQNHEMRTHEQTERNGRKAYRKQEPVHGVKGPTKLSELPNFDIVRSFVVDNLHCIDLGVARQLGHLWFDSSNHQHPWYLGKHIQEIDAQLGCILPPHEITRVPRSITQRAFWKGSEWHWWLLLYSPVILRGMLPSHYYKHLLLLVQGVYLLTKSSIRRSDVNQAQLCLSRFVRKFEVLYGKSHMTYNIHQLSHLTQTVIDWGPLPVYSSYIFEGFNMVQLRLFHGTQAVPRQIACSFLLYKAVSAISKSDPTSLVCSFMEGQLTGHVPTKKAKKVGTNITFVGASYLRKLGIEEKYVVEQYLNDSDVTVMDDAEFFKKAIVNGSVFHCTNYQRISRRKNYIVGMKDSIVFELVVFAIITFCEVNAASIAFGRRVKFGNVLVVNDGDCGHLCQHIKKIEETDAVLEVVDLNSIQDKFVHIDKVNQHICCKLPNIIDRD